MRDNGIKRLVRWRLVSEFHLQLFHLAEQYHGRIYIQQNIGANYSYIALILFSLHSPSRCVCFYTHHIIVTCIDIQMRRNMLYLSCLYCLTHHTNPFCRQCHFDMLIRHFQFYVHADTYLMHLSVNDLNNCSYNSYTCDATQNLYIYFSNAFCDEISRGDTYKLHYHSDVNVMVGNNMVQVLLICSPYVHAIDGNYLPPTVLICGELIEAQLINWLGNLRGFWYYMKHYVLRIRIFPWRTTARAVFNEQIIELNSIPPPIIT